MSGNDEGTAVDQRTGTAPAKGDLVAYNSVNPVSEAAEHGFALVAGLTTVTADDGSSSTAYDLIPVSRLGYPVPADGVQLVSEIDAAVQE